MPPQNMPPQKSPFQELLDNMRLAQGIMAAAAFPVILYLRRDCGFRFVAPLKVSIVTGAIAFVAILLTPGNEAARPMDVALYAVGAFIIGHYQRFRRWIDLKRGIVIHSYYIGTSRFDFRWLPAFVRRNRRVSRLVDPIVCMAVGILLLPVSRALGVWLMLSAMALRAFEWQVYTTQRDRNLDLQDSMIAAHRHIEVLNHYASQSARWQRGPEIPTGLGPDLQPGNPGNHQTNQDI